MISVIIPVYQVERYIAECLDSVCSQVESDLEIICVNDCTLDNSMTIVKEYAKRDSRIRIVHNDRNRGLGGARNGGIEAANGEFIAFVDSDDLLHPLMLREMRFLLEDSDADMVFCDVMLLEPEGTQTPVKSSHISDIKGMAFSMPDSLERFVDLWPSAWNKLYRTDIIRKNRIRYIENILYEDHTFYYEYILKCRSIQYLPHARYMYRHRREGQITRQVSPRIFEVFKILEEIGKVLSPHLDKEQFKRTMGKLTLRLCFERMSVMSPKDTLHERFYKAARARLSLYDKSDLIQNRDQTIPQDHPLLQGKVGNMIHKMVKSVARGVYSVIDDNEYKVVSLLGVKFKLMNYNKMLRDTHWAAWSALKNSVTKDELKTMEGRITKAFVTQNTETMHAHNCQDDKITMLDRRITQLQGEVESLKKGIFDSNAESTCRLDSLTKKLNVMPANVGELFAALHENIIGMNVAVCARHDEILKKIGDAADKSVLASCRTATTDAMERGFEKMTKKLNDATWLAWNIKDNIDAYLKSDQACTDTLTRYYPTWQPSEYPQYFHGNTWRWVTAFRHYAVKNINHIEQKMTALKSGLDKESAAWAERIWERYVHLLPLPEYADRGAVLLKTTVVFTQAELDEQKDIRRNFSKCLEDYVLPEGNEYEIPVFYYKHGLGKLPDEAKQLIASGDIIDVGAYIGDSCLVLSRYTNHRIFCIELDGNNFKMMQRTLALNHMSGDEHIQLVNCAVSNIAGDARFVPMGSSSSIFYGCDGNSGISANTRTIDDLVDEYEIVPTLIKIDIEGMELEAIQGAVNTIRKHRPVLLVSIYHTPKDFFGIKPFLDDLDLGYSFSIDNQNPFDPVYEKILICIPQLQ